MTIKLEDVKKFERSIVLKLKKLGILTVEQLSNTNVEDLTKNIKGVGESTALKYINKAKGLLKKEDNIQKSKEIVITKNQQEYLNGMIEELKTNITSKEKKSSENIPLDYAKPFFDLNTAERVKYLHYKIIKIEELIKKNSEELSVEDVSLIHEYINHLNQNYKMKSHNLILRELNIKPYFIDPLNQDKIIVVYDIMFECARVFLVLANLLRVVSNRFEKLEDWENAITSMVNCSKALKSAALFSAASINQKEISLTLDPYRLEIKSEEARTDAQLIACKVEEKEKNFNIVASLYAGLYLLLKRLEYLTVRQPLRKQLIKAQAFFNLGNACHFKAKANTKSKVKEDIYQQIQKLQEKANYYFSQAEEIWERQLKEEKDVEEAIKSEVKTNLKVVNSKIIENPVEILDWEQVKSAMEPDPVIVVPDNLPMIFPKSTLMLTKLHPKDLNSNLYRKYKHNNLPVKSFKTRKKRLLIERNSVRRLLGKLNFLFDNNDLNAKEYLKLYEKYVIKLKELKYELKNLKVDK